jgi:predicted HD superfamily hydrolase involved in NAD metabolism
MMKAPADSDALARLVLRRHPLRAHIMAVARLARDLARQNGVSPRRAELAALLHDWLKPWPAARLRNLLLRRRVRLDAHTAGLPVLWHGPAAAAEAHATLGIHDREVLDAVRWHTSGRPNPSKLLRILMISDFCAAGRDFPEARVGRALARRSLSAATRYVLACKVAWLTAHGHSAPGLSRCLSSIACRSNGHV